jgi:tol-pal system protein YbgF
MMTSPRSFVLLLAVMLVAPAGARAQSREQQQMFADLRILQEQVQQLRLAVNALVEQEKATGARLDAQAEQTRKDYADQLQLVREVSSSIEALGQKVSSNSAQVTKLSQELPPLRDGLNMLQQLISQIASQLQPMAAVDPNAGSSVGAGAGAGTPPPGSAPPTAGANTASLPPSPSTYYQAAMSYYAAGQWDLAVEGFRDFIQKFPNAPDAADAQFFIGESYYQSGKTREALAAYTAVPTTYKDSTRVPDAYFKQASCNELLGQRAEAIRVYQLIVKQYPESSAALLATQALKRLGVIK